MGESNGRITNADIEQKKWDYIQQRSVEVKKNGLTARLILNFDKGNLTSIMDQSIIAGSSVTSMYLDKLI